ncbi:MAG: hypothetical protein ACOYN3_09315 [Acidimicrobiia bacterium]
MTITLLHRNGDPSRTRGPEPESRITQRLCVLAGFSALIVGLVGGLFLANLTRSHATRVSPTTATSAASPAQPVNAGPTLFDGMVPVGYLHNQDGAVAAAASYTAMMTEMVFRTEAESRAAARRIAMPASADAVEASMMTSISGIRQAMALAGSKNPDGRGLVRSVPIGTRVISFYGDRARIDVWSYSYIAIELGGANESALTAPPTSVFIVTSYELEWTNGDWFVASSKVLDDAGPAITRAQPTPATPFIDHASAFTPFRYKAKQGGK